MCPNALGYRGAISAASAIAPSAWRSYVSSPVSCASRSIAAAALEEPDGMGESSRSLRLAISASPSAAVEKKPPCSGSEKRSIVSSASASAR
jgi:hypothetical protein